MLDMMLDLETLGTNHDSVIIQIGAVVFNRQTGDIKDSFSCNINIDSCLKRGLTVTGNTIFFWMGQSKEIQKTLLEPNPVSLNQALLSFKTFYEHYSLELVWCNTNFDAPILENAFKSCDLKYPIYYNKFRELRTIIDLAELNLDDYEHKGYHNALEDCLFQIKYLVDGLNKLIDYRDHYKSYA